MKKKTKSCFRCEETDDNVNLYGYYICRTCKSKIGLHKDETIERYQSTFKRTKNIPSFEDDMHRRLDLIEKDYVRKKIKLLHILERLKQIRSNKK